MYEFRSYDQISLCLVSEILGFSPKALTVEVTISLIKEQIVFPEIDYEKVDRVRVCNDCYEH